MLFLQQLTCFFTCSVMEYKTPHVHVTYVKAADTETQPDSSWQTCPDTQHRGTSDLIWSWWSLQVWGVESNAAFKLNIFPRVTWSTCIFPGWTAERSIVVLSQWVKFCVHFWRLTPRTLWSWKTKDSTQIYFNLWKMTSVGNLLIFNWMCRFNCPCSFTWVINKTCSWPVTFL